MEDTIARQLQQVLVELGVSGITPALEYPRVMEHGDLATNVALVCAKQLGKDPVLFAEEIVDKLRPRLSDVTSITVEKPGFINLRLSDQYFTQLATTIGEDWGRNDSFRGKKVVVEYTDPNPFKEFHIGHLFPNTVGESIARLMEWGGAEVKRANYQGDVGMHVAKAIWGMEKEHHNTPKEDASIIERAKFLGDAYAKGAEAFEADAAAKQQIVEINKKVYEKSDTLVDVLYRHGKRWSLEYFEYLYQLLGTKFDYYFFESETAPVGLELVREHIGDVFLRSDNAVIFQAEKFGLHTRVFVNSEGLPTYEAKELGLAKLKYETYPYDQSIVVTANEQSEYFKVAMKAIGEVFKQEKLEEKTTHIAHGTMRLASGKISSRKGNVPTALALIDAAKAVVQEKIDVARGFSDSERKSIAEKVALGAIKYAILRQQVGGDIIFDFNTSLSFEGDSGPYLQYTLARINSLLEKSTVTEVSQMPNEAGALPRLLARFPNVVVRSQDAYSAHHVATYLIQLAHEYNALYAKTQFIGSPEEGYYQRLTRATGATLRNGLQILSVPLVARM